MDRAHRTFVVTFGCVLGFLGGYFLLGLSPVRLPWYYPLEHRWEWVVRPMTLAMDWYGRLFLSLGASAVLGAVSFAVAGRWKPVNPAPAERALAAWTFMIFAFATALFLYQLLPRHPFPAALPPGYVPR